MLDLLSPVIRGGNNHRFESRSINSRKKFTVVQLPEIQGKHSTVSLTPFKDEKDTNSKPKSTVYNSRRKHKTQWRGHPTRKQVGTDGRIERVLKEAGFSSSGLWSLSQRNRARRILQSETKPDESKLVLFDPTKTQRSSCIWSLCYSRQPQCPACVGLVVARSGKRDCFEAFRQFSWNKVTPERCKTTEQVDIDFAETHSNLHRRTGVKSYESQLAL